MPLLSNEQMILGGLGGGIEKFLQSYMQASRFKREQEEADSNEQRKKDEMAIKAAENNLYQDPKTKEFKQIPGTLSKQQEKRLSDLSRVYGSLQPDEKASVPGRGYLAEMHSLMTGAPQQGMLPQQDPSQPPASGSVPMAVPQQGMLAVNPSDPFALAPGQKTVKEKELDEYKAKKLIDAEIDAKKEKAPKILPAGEASRLGSGEASIKKLNDIKTILDSNKDIFGPGTGFIGKYNPYDTRAQTAQAQIRATIQDIGTYLEGGKLSDADFQKKYSYIIPALTDTPEVVDNKILIAKKLIADKQNSELSALEGSGYQTKNLKKLEGGELPKGLVGKEKKVVKRFTSPSTGKIKLIYSDGSSEVTDGKK